MNKTRMSIKEAALRLIEKRAIIEISVVSLCREAGVARSAFYNNYSSMAEVLEEIRADIYREYETLVTNNCNIMEKVKKSLELVKEYKEFFELYFENKERSFVYLPYMEEHIRKYCANNNENLLEEPKYQFIKYGVGGAVHDWLRSGCEKDETELAKDIFTFVKTVKDNM